tara:strand:- start:5973 stop:6194 length:222 start_codon:yes stop_codon:yes gene_type:complete
MKGRKQVSRNAVSECDEATAGAVREPVSVRNRRVLHCTPFSPLRPTDAVFWRGIMQRPDFSPIQSVEVVLAYC